MERHRAAGQVEAGALEVVTAWPPAHGRAQHSVCEAGRRTRVSLQRADCGQDEQHRADERRDRVAGKPEDESVTPDRERQRLPRPHRDAPEHLLCTEPGDRAPDEVVWADRHASGRDEHVGLEPTGDGLAMRCLVVGDALVRLDDCACTGEERRHHHAVRLVDLALLELLAGRPELGARRDDRHARTPRARSARRPPRRRAPQAATA